MWTGIVGPQAGAARMLTDNLRLHLGPIRAKLAEIDRDPVLTDKQRERLRPPLVEEAQKIRDTLLTASTELVERARQKYLVALPRSQRRQGGARNPKQVLETMQLVLSMPVSELELLARHLAEDRDDAALYGLDLAIGKRDDIDLATRTRLIAALDAPYVDALLNARANLLATQQEHARLYFEVDPDSDATLAVIHMALVIPDNDGVTSLTVSQEAVNASYEQLGMSLSL